MEPRIASNLVRRLANCLFFAGLVLASDPARAEEQAPPPQPTSGLRAQQLFDEGRTLLKEGRFAEACTKLAESQELDPGGGTLLNLGICRKLEGRTATASRLLAQALEQARADGRADRIATAERNLAELGPLLSRLTLRLAPGERAPDLVVELDGRALAPEALGSALEVDPGSHQVRALRPGHVSFVTAVTVGERADRKLVEIPALAPEPAPPRGAPPPVVTSAPKRPGRPVPKRAPATNPRDPATPRWLAYGLIGTGAASLVAGSIFGIRALELRNDSDRHFDGTSCKLQSCVDDWNRAKGFALASDIGIGAGVALGGFGALLLVLDRPGRSTPRAAWSLALTPAGASVRGGF